MTMTYDRPSQHPTVRAPAPIEIEPLPLLSGDDRSEVSRKRSEHLGQWLVVVAAVACGTLLGVGASMRWMRTHRPLAAPQAVVAAVVTPEPAAMAPLALETPEPAPPAEASDPQEQEIRSPQRRAATRRRPRRAPVEARHAPAPVLDPPPAEPALDPYAIRSVVARGSPRLRQCYTSALRQTGSAASEHVQMTVDIAPAGTVETVSVTGGEIGTMASCLQRTAARWTFPASRRGARVPLTFLFRPTEA